MTLTDAERQSALWLKLQAHFEARLATLRAQNDNDHPAEYTAKLRGRIAEVVATLRLGAKPEALPAEIPAMD